jgi:hypothetical protein
VVGVGKSCSFYIEEGKAPVSSALKKRSFCGLFVKAGAFTHHLARNFLED